MTSTQDQLKRAQREADKRKHVDAMMLQIRVQRIPRPVIDDGHGGGYKFHPERRWMFDMAWVVDRVAIELHGGIWNRGEHVRGRGFIHNREKVNEAQLLGWTVLEVTPEHIKSGQAIEWLVRALPAQAVVRRA